MFSSDKERDIEPSIDTIGGELPNYIVYRIETKNGKEEYKAFDAELLAHPFFAGSANLGAFLPAGKKFHLELRAETKQQAIEKAKGLSSSCWEWSGFNWGEKPNTSKYPSKD